MCSQSHNSEVSPPPSLSRPRPWSPDSSDPLPPLRSFGGQSVHKLQANDNGWTSATHPYPRDGASDPSIDTLDLADYTRTFNPFPSDPTFDSYPLPPPRSVSVTSHASLNPPSFASSRGIPTPRSYGTSSMRYPSHRAFPPSIPVSSQSLTQPSVYIPPDNAPYSPNILHPPFDTTSSHGVPNSEIDISQFPAWSRGWYTKDRSLKTEPQSEASRALFFDPSYNATKFSGNQYNPYAATSSSSCRDFVPWSSTDTPSYDLPLDPELKEERIRMLEHEFRPGSEPSTKEEPVGSVDEKGRLITDGPKKRVTMRVIETVLALGIAFAVVYAALWTKPRSPPPPQSKPYTLALYALSILTSLFFLYRFLFRPCCCGSRGKKRNLAGFGPDGLTVLPVRGLQGGNKKKKKGKKGKQEQGNVQVNLIVDPTMFGSALRQDDEGSANPDEYHPSSLSQARTSGRLKRRSIFEGLAIEEQWRAARKELKWMLFLDTVCFFLWSVEFMWILTRERCPPGGFNGWCNAYNVASAGACLLGLVFGLNVFFDVKDIHQSRISPRTRI